MGDLLQIVRNIAAIVPNLQLFFLALSWLFGVIFIIMALRLTAKRSALGPSAGDWSQPMWMFIIGALFIAIPALIRSLSVSIFGAPMDTDPSSIFAYAPSTIGLLEASEPAREIVVAVVTIIRFVGLIAIMRGLYLLNRTSQGGGGPATFGPGVTFVLGGILAMNFQMFVGVMERFITG